MHSHCEVVFILFKLALKILRSTLPSLSLLDVSIFYSFYFFSIHLSFDRGMFNVDTLRYVPLVQRFQGPYVTGRSRSIRYYTRIKYKAVSSLIKSRSLLPW